MFDSNLLQKITEHLALSSSQFIPEIALVITFILALFADVIFKKTRNIAGYTVLLGFIVTGVLLSQQSGISKNVFISMIAIDPFALFFKYLVLISSAIVVIMSFFSEELNRNNRRVGEYYSLISGMTFGMFLLSGATNLIMIYLAIEILSITSYVLAGYTKEIKRSSEASLKYVIYGSVSSGIMVYGMSILFGASGTLSLYELTQLLNAGQVDTLPLLVSGLMIISGFGYKISAVPFHFWTPDVYEGAPVTITAYLSVASKAAGFAAFIRFAQMVFASSAGTESAIDWQIVIALLSVLTMTLGNLSALRQTNVKRILAYSAIAHAGYMLMAMVMMNEIGTASILIYMFMYLFMNLGAFAVVMFIANKIGSEDIEDYNGMGYKMPVMGVCMVIFLISLTGIPPTGGFIGKLYVFTAVLEGGTKWLWLAVIGILNSVVSLFYYAKIFRNMYLRGTDTKETIETPLSAKIIVIALAVPTILFGVYFSQIVDWANNSAAMFFVR